MEMLALHLLQSSLVHVNTLLVQQVLAELAWASRWTDEDRRGLTALFWSNVNPYGTFRLDMGERGALCGCGLLLVVLSQHAHHPRRGGVLAALLAGTDDEAGDGRSRAAKGVNRCAAGVRWRRIPPLVTKPTTPARIPPTQTSTP
jgi:hypothetical protein